MADRYSITMQRQVTQVFETTVEVEASNRAEAASKAYALDGAGSIEWGDEPDYTEDGQTDIVQIRLNAEAQAAKLYEETGDERLRTVM